jgi:menaquinone-specific isochorismate synthase
MVTALPVEVRTRLVDPSDLLSMIPADAQPLSWVHEGDGLVAWDVAATTSVRGPERFARAQRWWTRFCETAAVDDEVMTPGTGPVAFGSFSFDAAEESVITVPGTIAGQRDGKAWITTISPSTARPLPTATGGRLVEPGPDGAHYRALVAEAVDSISAGLFDKVVLARDVRVTGAIDVPRTLQRLAERYADCWTFSVHGLIGATPELLVRRTGEQVMSRVLAGTVPRSSDERESGELADGMVTSDKAREEHAYAVMSVAQALGTHCTDLDVPAHPSVLRLANVQHLATDIHAMLVDETSVVAIAAALHPTAAVCGTPTERALQYILSREQLHRGRYAGPIGWFDANGDGEFGIALRCGQLSDDYSAIDLYAGCGIVAGSDPDSEFAESESKLAAMRWALGED